MPISHTKKGVSGSLVRRNETPARIPNTMPTIATTSVETPRPTSQSEKRRIGWRRERGRGLESLERADGMAEKTEKGTQADLQSNNRGLKVFQLAAMTLRVGLFLMMFIYG